MVGIYLALRLQQPRQGYSPDAFHSIFTKQIDSGMEFDWIHTLEQPHVPYPARAHKYQDGLTEKATEMGFGSN
jgi:hypothetical protein